MHPPVRPTKPVPDTKSTDSPSASAPDRGVQAGEPSGPRIGLLCVANFPANTGYAWNFIEGLFAGVSERLARQGVVSWVAYPSIPSFPETLRGSAAQPVEMAVHLHRWRSLRTVLSFVRRNRIRVVYLTDRPSWHPAYALLRAAGVRRIVVHDHTSGDRTRPTGVKRLVKLMLRRIPGMLADEVVAVSDYVARRKVHVDLVPPERVTRLWNSVTIPAPDPHAARRLRELLGLEPHCIVVGCAGRSTPEKGISHLLLAFERAHTATAHDDVPLALVYIGAGPDFDDLCRLRDTLSSRDWIILTGYRPDAAELLGGADLCVVPSVWQEAFGLAALEPMARGVPVIATSVGGIPEVVAHKATGLLVSPGDDDDLARAMIRLIRSPAERKEFGANGRRRVEAYFTLDRELDELARLLDPGRRRRTALPE